MLPLQQPLGHDFASQTHRPVVVSHSWPLPHAAHAAPADPQEVLLSDAYASHVPVAPPLQQPLGHVSASQAQVPVLVSHSPLVQAEHAAPPVPHCELPCDP